LSIKLPVEGSVPVIFNSLAPPDPEPIFPILLMDNRIINGVVDRLFNRLNQEPECNSTPVSLPNVIQRIVSNPALPEVEGELRNSSIRVDC
jgi:hypothetical protein